jgi:riboflavin kinase/FMN adenylyltransferase
MQIAYFPDSPRPGWPRPVVALGNFDGLHRGHMKLVDEVRRQAAERGGTAVAMTFDPHPARVLRPDKAPPLLMTLEQKLDAFERAGLQAVAIVRFSEELSRWEPELFVEAVLLDWLRLAEVWVGANFLFGRHRAGTFTLLRTLAEDRGFRAEKIEPIRYKDFVVSSTRVRHLVAEGRVDEAAALLGHHYFLDGHVVRGDGRGRELGFPTANLATANELLPAGGVYATIAGVGETLYASVSSVGVRPSIGDGRVTVETHVLHDDPQPMDLYGQRMRVAFVQWIRDQQAYESLGALGAAIARDVAHARALFEQIGL